MTYLRHHDCIAKCGKPDTLDAAAALEKRGMIARVGEWSGPNPGIIFHLTEKGMGAFGYGATPIDQLKSALSSGKKVVDVSIKERPIVA